MKRFNRFELKYAVTATQAEAVRCDLAHHMVVDDNSTDDGCYDIASLYYDTPDLAFMRAKREGIKFRRKVRIRRYGKADALADDNQPVYVEIKQRINRTTQKRRLTLPLAAAYALCAGHLEGAIEDATDSEAADEVLFLVRSLDLQPTCLVGYRREAFVGSRYEPGLRVTFDNSLWAAQADGGLAQSNARHAIVPPQTYLMEVKANNAVPVWLASMLARHRCTLTRYSKYCAAVACLDKLDLLVLAPVASQ